MDQQTKDEILKNLESIIMEKQFRMETYKAARAHYTGLYMREKAELIEYLELYGKVGDQGQSTEP